MTETEEPTHECPGPGCTIQVSKALLGCRRHWYQVSAPTRARVWRTYKAGPGSPDHLQAIRQAMSEMRP